MAEDRLYLDHGLTGPNRQRPGLDQAPAAVRAGDTLVVPKLDRLARSVPDARAIGDELADQGVALSLGGQVHDPNDPMRKMFFNILATFAEFEADLLRMRTREGMTIARASMGRSQYVRPERHFQDACLRRSPGFVGYPAVQIAPEPGRGAASSEVQSSIPGRVMWMLRAR